MQYLLTINSLFNFTLRELEILALLYDYLYDIKYSNGVSQTSLELRKYIMTKTKVNKNNLTKYLKVFERAGIIYKDSNNILIISTDYEPIITDNMVEVKFNIVING